MNIIGHIYIKKPIYKIEWEKMSLILLKNGCSAMNFRVKICQTKVQNTLKSAKSGHELYTSGFECKISKTQPFSR